MARIFISYAHEDQAAARRIVDALAREGLDAWWDHEIPPGRSWDEVIGARIGAASVVIVIWSAQSVASNFVKEEAQIAYDAGKLVPVKVDEIEPPVGFRRTHAANLVDWGGRADHAQWRALLGEIHDRLEGGTAPAPIKRRAASRQTGGAWRWMTLVAAIVAVAAVGAWWMLQQPPSRTAPEQATTETATAPEPTRDEPATMQAPTAASPQRSDPQSAGREAADVASNGDRGETPAPPSIAGTVWSGEVRDLRPNAPDIRRRYRFNADGSAEWADESGAFVGRESHSWTQDGATVVWRHNTGSTYRATIENGVMTGSAASLDGSVWATFVLRRE